MLLDARTYPLLLTLSVCTPFVASQVVSGCPSYGCTPTGSFALLTSAGIPRSGVSVIWTTQISNSSGTGSPLLGCVSNNKHIVCPTQEGYVGLNSTTGSVIWRDNNLANPTLPIMDVTGDVIGTNGTFLMKIDSNGTTEQPVIPLVPPMHPVYSVVFGEGNIALLVSQTGELVAYLTNGTPLANLFLTGTVERYNGTFHPIAQPVMNGSRAYILTQFKPDPQYTQIPRDKIMAILGLQRLYAVDVPNSVAQPINIVWWVNMELEVNTRCRPPSDDTQDLGPDPSRTGDNNKPEFKNFTFSRQPSRSKTSNANLKFRGLKETVGLTPKNIVDMNQNSNEKSRMKLRRTEIPDSFIQISELLQNTSGNASLLYWSGIVMASVAPPVDLCHVIQTDTLRHCCMDTEVPKLWGVQDNGANMTVMFTDDLPLSFMSVYDHSYTPTRGQVNSRNNLQGSNTTQDDRVMFGTVVWIVPPFGEIINGHDRITGVGQQIVNLTLILNTTLQITSPVMVGLDPVTMYINTLIFGIQLPNKTQSFKVAGSVYSTNNYTNFLIAVDTTRTEWQENVIWALPVPNNFEVQGQISVLEVTGNPNVSFVVTAQGPDSQIAFAYHVTP